MRRSIVLLCLAWVLAGVPVRASTLILAALPRATPVEVGQRWTPLLGRLEHDTLLRFQLRAFTRHDAFERDVAAGIPDLALLDAHQLARAAREHGYQPLVYSARPLVTVLVASHVGDPPAPSHSGRRVALSVTGDAAAVLVPAPDGGGNVRVIEVQRPRNVHRHVLLGHADLGVTTEADLAREPVSVRQRLRVIERTAPRPGYVLVAHPRVTQDQRRRLREALVRLGGEADGQAMLEAVDLADVRVVSAGHPEAAVTAIASPRDVVTPPRPPLRVP